MGIFKTWYDWVQDLGQATGDFTQQVSTGLVRLWCNTANKYPNLTAFNPFGRGLLESYCPLVSAPTPPDAEGFIGGQCEGVAYVCTGIYVNGNVTLGGCYETKTWTSAPILGRVTGLRIGLGNGAGVQIENHVDQVAQVIDDGTDTLLRNDSRQCGYTTVSAPQAYAGFIRIVECHPADDSEDLCGDLIPTFPPDPPIEANDFRGNLVYNVFNDQGDPIYSDILNYTINVSPGDIMNLNIDLGGVNFTFGSDGINTPSPVAPDGGGGGDESPPPFNEVDFEPTVLEEGEELEVTPEEQEDEERIAWVTVDITTVPFKGKTVLQGNEEDNDYFAGYLAWTIPVGGGKYRLPQQPVRKRFSAFKAPDNVVGFRVYSVNGAKLSATIHREKVEE